MFISIAPQYINMIFVQNSFSYEKPKTPIINLKTNFMRVKIKLFRKPDLIEAL